MSTNTSLVFELSGGELCLDFANTVDNRTSPERLADHLESYPALLSFGEQTGVVPASERQRLSRKAAQHPAEAARALRQALELRETLYRIFSAIAAGRQPAAADLRALNRFVNASLSRLQVQPTAGGYSWRWQDDGALEALVWRVAKSAADLLTSPEAGKVRQCAAEDCAWLFLDRSHNRTRRWCDMTSCGNRAKARRHYQRVKGSAKKS
jgi:predicted RNA-binding Zn ribbon-like protein